MYMYNLKAKGISCILFYSDSSFKLAGTHEHDKMAAHSCE